MKNLFVIILVATSNLLFAQSIPYSVNKKKYPLGEDFDKIMPLKIGNWTRYAFHDFVIGRETGTVYYKLNDKQVYLTFGKAYSQTDLSSAWTRIYDNATSGKEKQIKQKSSTGSTTKYILMQSTSNLYFAWTRNLYYFSIQTKYKTDADEFMKLFPY